MHKIIALAAFALTATVASVQTASAFDIIWLPPSLFNKGGEITSPGEPFQPFRGQQRTQTASIDALEEACDEMGGELMQIQDGSTIKWACVR